MPAVIGAVHAVTFDAAGTLIRVRGGVAQVYADLGRRHGSRLTPGEVAERFRHAFRRHEDEDLAGDMTTDEERERCRWQRIVGEVLDDVSDPRRCFEDLFAHFASPGAWQLYGDVADTLNTLTKRGLRLGIASNFDERLLAVVSGHAPLGMGPVLISSRVGHRKPHGAFFTAVVEALGLPAQQILHVGDDRRNDYQGARAAGMEALLLKRNGNDGAEVIDSLTQVVEML